jgi:hypothetical protein
MNLPPAYIKQILEQSTKRFLSDDLQLLTLDAHERTITARLAYYLQEQLPEWNVDCEYNRIKENVKEVVIGQKLVLVVPDIIIHQRSTGNNLLVVEVKKLGTKRLMHMTK